MALFYPNHGSLTMISIRGLVADGSQNSKSCISQSLPEVLLSSSHSSPEHPSNQEALAEEGHTGLIAFLDILFTQKSVLVGEFQAWH